MICAALFAAHFAFADDYFAWAHAAQDGAFHVQFQRADATPGRAFVDTAHRAQWRRLACDPNPTTSTLDCVLELPQATTWPSTDTLMAAMRAAGERGWRLQDSGFGFRRVVPNPSGEWWAAARSNGLHIATSLLLLIACGWRPGPDARNARDAFRHGGAAWIFLPLAGGALFSLLRQGAMALLAVPGVMWPGVASSVLVAPACEEIIYRGWLFVLFPAVRPVPFALGTALMFSLSHGADAGPSLYFFASGVLLALVLLRTRSLLLAMLAHLIHNAVALV